MYIKKQTTRIILCMLLVLFSFSISVAQRVGVVLSGGGASGIAHVGVLKALEENNIPIDYISGSSEGALIGALYAAGYSPVEIEKMFNSAAFKDMAQGVIDHKYQYYFKRSSNDASWISFKVSIDSSVISPVLPTNLISPIPLDFGLMEYFGAPAAAAKYNFDSLFIPYRCVAADIEKKESVIFKKGDLGEAIRASATYPFYISPIMVNGKLLFDGGLYNNFPANIVYDDFFPDIIIGSNMGVNTKAKEDDLLSQIKCMLQSESHYSIPCENGVLIQPDNDVGLFDFNHPQPIIDSGYTAAMRQMETIKNLVTRRTTADELAAKRKNFKAKEPAMVFDSVSIDGLTSKQSEYAKRILHPKKDMVGMEEVKEGYFRLAGDSKIKSIYPKAIFDPKKGFYELHLRIKKDRDISTFFGGNLSNMPISEGFFGLQYNYLSRFATSSMANVYFGKLYNSVQLKTRIDFPLKTPVFIEPNITWNSWDYYKSSDALLGNTKPPYLKQGEEFGGLNAGLPTGKKGRIVGGVAATEVNSYYYQIPNFTTQETPDHTQFQALTSQLFYEVNSLNRKMYANQGEYILAKMRVVNGNETTIPGSTSVDSSNQFEHHLWYQLKLNGERYFNRRGTFKIGVMGEGVYSTQTNFQNYNASILTAPAFQPTPDSKTIFIQENRAYKYMAGGIKLIVNIRKNLQLRAEGYIFQPYETLIETSNLKTSLSLPFQNRNYIGMGAMVWDTPIGPMSLSVNYFSAEKNPVAVLFHFGYIIFNNRSLD